MSQRRLPPLRPLPLGRGPRREPSGATPAGREVRRARPGVCGAGRPILRQFLDRLMRSTRVPSTVLGLPPPSWGPATVPLLVGIHPPADTSVVHRPIPRLPATRPGQVRRAARGGRNTTLPPRPARPIGPMAAWVTPAHRSHPCWRWLSFSHGPGAEHAGRWLCGTAIASARSTTDQTCGRHVAGRGVRATAMPDWRVSGEPERSRPVTDSPSTCPSAGPAHARRGLSTFGAACPGL